MTLTRPLIHTPGSSHAACLRQTVAREVIKQAHQGQPMISQWSEGKGREGGTPVRLADLVVIDDLNGVLVG